jgi:hydroxymethylbilane synthase
MNPTETRSIILGSRPSKLARWQTEHVRDLLQAAWPALTCRIVFFETQGDKNLAQPLPEIGGKGVFTTELETALRSGEIDLAVHSLKDLPVAESPELCIAAISQRADARDVLISANGKNLASLSPGSRIGTSSLRRSAQIAAFRADLRILPLRGNVDTRIQKALRGEYDAILLAAAGLERLQLTTHITQYLPLEVMLPAPGQGALAIQARDSDEGLHSLLAPLHHPETAAAVSAERAFLAALGGGCSAPVAAFAQVHGSRIRISGFVGSPDGEHSLRVTTEAGDPGSAGETLARLALEQGAGELLR